jgi:site-specific recombinase XerD
MQMTESAKASNTRIYSPQPLQSRLALTPIEQQRLWDACPMQDVCERLVLALLLEMGLRPPELFALTDQALQPGALSALGKGGRVSTMSIGEATQQALDRYLAAYPPIQRGDGLLVQVDEAGLADIVLALGRRVGLGRPLSVHVLRYAAILRIRAALGKGDDK